MRHHRELSKAIHPTAAKLATGHSRHRSGCRCRTGAVRVGLRILRQAAVEWLRQSLLVGDLSRAALGRRLCEQDDCRNAKGRYCEASAHKALPGLAQQLQLERPLADD